MEDGKPSVIRVVIYAPDAITHAGLSALVRQRPELVEVSGDGEHADVIVLAVDKGDAAMMRLLDELSPEHTAWFLVVVDKIWYADIVMAVEHGVRAVLWRKQTTHTEFMQALATVGNGGGYYPPSLQGTLMEQVRHTCQQVLKPLELTPSGLTGRELDVLRLLSEGLGIEEISQKLSYSERTVKNILHKLIKRFGFRNRTHAVSYVIRAGLF